MPPILPLPENSIKVLIGRVGLGTISAGSSVLNVTWNTLPSQSVSQTFSTADVGRIVTVMGAGAGGGLLIAKVSAYNGPGQVTLDTPAGANAVAGVNNATIYRPVSCTSGSIECTLSVTTAQEARFNTEQLAGEYPPLEGQPVLMTSSDSEIGGTYGAFFGGEITSANTHNYGDNVKSYTECSCASYRAIAHRRVVPAKQYSSNTVQQIAQDFIDTVNLQSEYLSLNSITGPTIPLHTVDNLTFLSDALDNLVAAGSTLTSKLYWDTDPWRTIIIDVQGAHAAPWTANDFDTTDGNILLEISNLRSTDKLSNQVYTKASKGLGDPITETGQNSFGGFPLPVPRNQLSLKNNAAVPPKLVVAGVTQRIYVSPIDPRNDTTPVTIPAGYNWAWPANSDYLFTNIPGGGVPSGGTYSITYQVGSDVMGLATVTTSVNSRAAVSGGSGLFENVVNIDYPLTKAELDVQTQSEVLRFSVPPEQLVAKAPKAGLKPGQLWTVNSSDINAHGNYFIETVRLDTSSNVVLWEITAAIGALVGDWDTSLINALGLNVVSGGGGLPVGQQTAAFSVVNTDIVLEPQSQIITVFATTVDVHVQLPEEDLSVGDSITVIVDATSTFSVFLDPDPTAPGGSDTIESSPSSITMVAGQTKVLVGQ